MNAAVNIFNLKAPLQNKFQALANALRRAKDQEAKGKSGTDTVRGKFYPLIDQAFGENTYVVYQSREPFPNMRMVRQMQQPREFDIELLRAKLTPAQFAAITVTKIDVEALDVALKRKEVPDDVISESITYKTKANLLWVPAGARSEFHLLPGQLAIVGAETAEQEEA